MDYNLVESYVGGKPVVSKIIYHYPTPKLRWIVVKKRAYHRLATREILNRIFLTSYVGKPVASRLQIMVLRHSTTHQLYETHIQTTILYTKGVRESHIYVLYIHELHRYAQKIRNSNEDDTRVHNTD